MGQVMDAFQQYREMEQQDEAERYQRAFGETFLQVVPKRYHKARAEHLSEELRAWTWERGPLLFGPRGVGKTHTAASMLLHHGLLNRWLSPVWLNTAVMLESMRRSFDKGGAQYQLPPVERASVVVLDDLGRERRSEWTEEILYTLINTLYDADVPVIATTNLTGTQLEAHLGEFSYDRLCEMLRGIKMEGESRRRAS